MSLNLIQQAKDLFSGEVVDQASSQLGESSTNITSALAGIVPTIFSGLINKSENAAGTDMIANLATNATEDGNGSSIISSLFGGSSNGIASAIANFAGIKSGSASSLMGIAGSAIMGMVGKYMSSNNVNASGLSSLFASQKEHVAAAMPAGLNLSSLLGGAPTAGTATASAHQAVDHSTKYAADTSSDVEAGGGLQWLIPVLLLALLGAGALYYFKGCKDTSATGGAHKDGDTHATMPAVSGDTAATGAMTAGNVDADGNYIYNVGEVSEIALPNGGGTLKVGQNSTEAKLVRFLQGADAVDTVKGSWFDFTNVYFNSGKSTITESSMTQLKNMAAIAKAFPKATFKIGGYTDNTGNQATNVTLSKERAAIVAAKLKEMGSTNIISSDGYGSEHAIADNGTAEGKAQNRRVSVNVKSK